ncbi:protein of unknown function (plasmid) [Shinella sp. WSC3-e]|nr:protein of unknown function [Shinella sp. WSC3-e]
MRRSIRRGWPIDTAETALEGRLGADAAVLFGQDRFSFGPRQAEFGLDLAALRGIGVADFGFEFQDRAVEVVGHRRLLDVL